MTLVKSGVARATVLAVSAMLLTPTLSLQAREQGGKKASLSLKATPAVAFAPARLTVAADLKGGSDDSDELYCPTVEWEWGDETTSVQEADCEPFTPGKSAIKRRFIIQHQFKNPGTFRVSLRLKKGDKIVASANTTVQVKPGLGQ